ncbi:MAG: choline kinase family protein [Eubacteriales bacterium]|nr:choline kinase family protein [Eubacteriales bacterium]
MADDKKNFWSILRADEISKFMELVDLTEKILGEKTQDIEVLQGGLTNKSFKVTLADGHKVVLRMGGAGTGEYINRAGEKHNCIAASMLGIAPEVYYFDTRSGCEVTNFVEKPTMHLEDFQNDKAVVEAAAGVLKRLHNCGMKFQGTMDHVQGIKDYAKILEDKKYEERFEGWDEIYDTVLKIDEINKKNPPIIGPIHADTLAENWMWDGNDMTLIDWEYGGVGDIYSDVAGIITEDLLTDEMTDVLLKAYFGEPTEEQVARVMVDRFVYCEYWSIWSLVQMANGKDPAVYWDYGNDRAQLGLQYMKEEKWDSYIETLAK